MPTSATTPIHGYSRQEVDDFLNAAAEERARLEATIADANSRASRARAALGTHRVMVAMLLETQRELGQMRSDAEKEAEAIVAEAEREVSRARGLSRDADIDLSTFAPAPGDAAPVATSADVSFITTNGEAPAPKTNGAVAEEGDDYFAFLRGALDDDQPLGPRPG